jgi:uncharacterized protein (DUF1778 family)
MIDNPGVSLLNMLPNWQQFVYYAKKQEVTMQVATSKKISSDDRIVSRIPRYNRVVIEKAAAIYGATINQFIVQSALDRASEIMSREELLQLSDHDAQIFLDAVDKPPLPNKELIEAINQHNRLIKC